MKRFLATTLLLLAFSGCDKFETVKNESTEAVTNLQNEASDLKETVGEKVDQVNGAVESVGDAVDSVNTAVQNVKSITQ